SARGPLPPQRRLIPGLALAVVIAVAAAQTPAVAVGQESPPAAAAEPTAAGDNHGIAISVETKAAPDQPRDGKADDSAAPSTKSTPDAGSGKRIITVTKDGKTVTLTGFPGDREFDSLGDFVHTE